MASCFQLSLVQKWFQVVFVAFSCLGVITAGSGLQQQAAYFSAHPFHVLQSPSQINIHITVAGSLDCASSCLRFKPCIAFNIAVKNDSAGRYPCELLAVDKTTHELKINRHFDHYELLAVLNPCESSPCKNGGKCNAIARGRDYSCFCTASFTGKNCQTENWIKLNTSPRCFGTHSGKYSDFINNYKGVLLSMKLVHLNGDITCDATNKKGWNYWGCADFSGNHMYMSVIVTDVANRPLIPETTYFISSHKTYNIPGYTVFSPELVFPKLLKPIVMVVGQEYRVWFGQDLADSSENNNGGTACVDVFGLFQ